MSAPAEWTPATDSPESFLQSSRVPSLVEADADAAWRRSFCGPQCLCDECADRRARSLADEQPSLLGIDLADPAFIEQLKRAERVCANQEAIRRYRTALRIALERWNR
jgi:hypothetical protein